MAPMKPSCCNVRNIDNVHKNWACRDSRPRASGATRAAGALCNPVSQTLIKTEGYTREWSGNKSRYCGINPLESASHIVDPRLRHHRLSGGICWRQGARKSNKFCKKERFPGGERCFSTAAISPSRSRGGIDKRVCCPVRRIP